MLHEGHFDAIFLMMSRPEHNSFCQKREVKKKRELVWLQDLNNNGKAFQSAQRKCSQPG